jgi:Glycosyltransferase
MKNLKTIIKAVALARNDVPDIKLTIIGDLREENEKLIKNLDLQRNIEFKNKLSRLDLIKTLNNSDIGISGSLYEGFGFPLVEMISSGLPVITSNKGSLPELASDAGLIFEANSSSDLADKIKNLIKKNDLRKRLINNARNRRDDFFGWDEYAKRLEIVYQNIIRGNI